ncbi:MAG: multicopper oxidase domain-containing protein, partial [Anaerolineae bacterium]
SDQGLAKKAEPTDTLVFEPGSRYDIVFDFAGLEGKRIIMENIGGDEPFGGTFTTEDPALQIYGYTNRIMAFDVVKPLDTAVPDDFDPNAIEFGPQIGAPTKTRRVGLFEGKDEYGRLQPLLGTVAEDLSEATAYTWFLPTTEKPVLGPSGEVTEEWEIYNFTEDAHPIHLHLVSFEFLGRNEIDYDADEDDPQMVAQHNGTYGTVAAISDITVGAEDHRGPAEGYVENAPKDMITALPDQVTKIKATFDKTGRYVWHCHILSHEDHEMMRVLEVEPSQ